MGVGAKMSEQDKDTPPCQKPLERKSHVYDGIIRERSTRGEKFSVGKHTAANVAHLTRVIAELESDGKKEAAETIIWLLWWRIKDSQWHDQVDEMRVEEINELRSRLERIEHEEQEGWCGHCACQSCYDAKRRNEHW